MQRNNSHDDDGSRSTSRSEVSPGRSGSNRKAKGGMPEIAEHEPEFEMDAEQLL